MALPDSIVTAIQKKQLLQLADMWNNRPEKLSDEWVDKFTKLVNDGPQVKLFLDPRQQEPL